jgi:hypothetical protein
MLYWLDEYLVGSIMPIQQLAIGRFRKRPKSEINNKN